MSDLQKLLKISHASFIASFPDLDIVESNDLGIEFLKPYNASNLNEVLRIDEKFIEKIKTLSQVNMSLVTNVGKEVVVSARLIEVKSKPYISMTIVNSLDDPDIIAKAYDLNEEIDRNGLFSKVFNHSPIGLVLIDSDNILYRANKYIFDCFGYDFREIIGERFGNVFACSTVQGSHKLCGRTKICKACMLKNGLQNVLENHETLENVEMTHEFRIDDQEVVKWFTISATPVNFSGKTYALVSFVDITERIENENTLRVLGITDELTSLSNRRHIIELLEEGLNSIENKMTVALLDVDNFKSINDHFGHLVGDDILRLAGDVLKMSVRLNDYVGRYGGEEFLLLFFETDLIEATMIIDRIRTTMKIRTNQLIDREMTFSCGILEIHKRKENVPYTDILRQTDNLLHEAKTKGKDCNASNMY